MLTTSLAGTSVQRGHFEAGASAASVPTSSNSAAGCEDRNARQPGSVADGP